MQKAKDKNWFNIKIYEKLTPSLEKKVKDLKKYCTEGGRKQTLKEKAEHFDKFCSKNDRVRYIFAVEEEKIIGMIILLKREISHKGHKILLGGIGGVRTRDDKRQKGVATKLLKEGMKNLHKLNCDIAYLCTNIKHPVMLALYGRAGFVPLGKPHTYLGKSGKRYTDKDGMIVPVKSQQIFSMIINDKEVLDIGKGNW